MPGQSKIRDLIQAIGSLIVYIQILFHIPGVGADRPVTFFKPNLFASIVALGTWNPFDTITARTRAEAISYRSIVLMEYSMFCAVQRDLLSMMIFSLGTPRRSR